MEWDLIVIGGGAGGFFGAIQTAEKRPDFKILLLEKGKRFLDKVKISGGGRCNVTHACFDPNDLVEFYPRGGKELRGPFHRFMCGDMMAWLEEKNVPTKIEADGRVFPESNSSQTIIDCFLHTAKNYNIKLHTDEGMKSFRKTEKDYWEIKTKENTYTSKNILLATGSSNAAWKQIAELGHQIVSPAPSLFTFNIKNKIIKDLPGLSMPDASIKIPGTPLEESGPLLITHWGLSGPAVLKLSAWGARILQERNYNFNIQINWISKDWESTKDFILNIKKTQGVKKCLLTPLFGFPKRLWQRLLEIIGMEDKQWANISKKDIQELVDIICRCSMEVRGKSTFKEEFVTAGGIELKEVNFKTMESKKWPGLFFAGEVLNIDAVTGGFNFQAAWTTAWVAAEAITGK